MVAGVEDIVEGIINVNYKVTVEVLMEVYSKIINRKNTIFIRS